MKSLSTLAIFNFGIWQLSCSRIIFHFHAPVSFTYLIMTKQMGFGNFQFWQISILATFQSKQLSIFTIFNFDNFQFWQFSILAIYKLINFHFWQFWQYKLSNFQLGNFQFWQFWQLSILTTFSFGYFQAEFLNGVQDQQEQQEHINCMDLVIKNPNRTCSFIRQT